MGGKGYEWTLYDLCSWADRRTPGRLYGIEKAAERRNDDDHDKDKNEQ